MTGDDFLKLAGELFARTRSPSEALFRTVVNRAYYGAHHLAVAFLADLGLPKLEDHETPIAWLLESGVENAKRAGRLLRDLYGARRRADYKLDQAKAVQESQDALFVRSQIEMATDIKLLLVSCASGPARLQVQTGIQAFRQRTARPPGSA
jgi:hypothetical protein